MSGLSELVVGYFSVSPSSGFLDVASTVRILASTSPVLVGGHVLPNE